MGCGVLRSFVVHILVSVVSVFSAEAVVTYEEFGAVGDGKKDDFAAIVEAHRCANERGEPVRAKDGATYYIGGAAQTAVIRTDVDFGTARFIIDDTEVENRNTSVFSVPSDLSAFPVEGIGSLARGQTNLGVRLPMACLVRIENDRVRQYIRSGANANDGAPQQEVLVVKPNGDIDGHTPVLQPYAAVTRAMAYPIDAKPLVIRGGVFRTIANREQENLSYFGRGISVRRSRTRIEGLRHEVTGEGTLLSPYGGFVSISLCAGVRVKDSFFSSRLNACRAGTYDITVSSAVSVSFVNCRELTDICDRKRWGVIGTNYSRNLLFDGCEFSRFDAHCGVANATVRNSRLGHMGIEAIGYGTFLIENTTVYGNNFVSLRGDYGSTWDGDVVIRNCTFVPACGQSRAGVLVGGRNDGRHDYGYVCRMPRRIVVEGLKVDDSNHPANYAGPWIFSDFNPARTGKTYSEPYPYHIPEEVVLKDIMTASGERFRLSPNEYMFKDVRVVRQGMRRWKPPK